MNPLTTALAALVTSALPMIRWLSTIDRPSCTVEEAIEIDRREDAILEAWMARR